MTYDENGCCDDPNCGLGCPERKEAFTKFGPGWPTIQQEPPNLIELSLEEAVQLLIQCYSTSSQGLVEKLAKHGVVLARRAS